MEEESESLSQEEKKVLLNLQALEGYAALSQYTDAEVVQIFQIVVETVEWVAESIEDSDVELALQIMSLLDFLDKVGGCHQNVNFTARLGNSRMSYIIKVNFAACYQA